MLKTYDPKTVHVIVGVVPIGGFADGTGIRVMRSNDTFDKIVGIGGVVSRSKNLDKSGEIQFTLEQTSTSNDVLSALMLADELANSAVTPIFLIDTGSKTVIVSAYGWIRKPPNVEYSKSLSQREWIFDVADIDIFVGGNSAQE